MRAVADSSLVEFEANIAMESALLEKICNEELGAIKTVHFRTTRIMAALEEYPIIAQEDNASIISKLLSYIRKFIDRLIDNINKFFGKGSAKENAEFVRSYRGPSDDNLADALKIAMRHMAQDSPDVSEKLKTIPALPNGSDIKQVEQVYEQVTGVSVTKESKAQAFKEYKLNSVLGRLGQNNLHLLNAMLDKEFADKFKTALDLVETVSNKRPFNDTIGDHVETLDKVSQLVMDMTELTKDREGKDNVEKWILGEDSSLSNRSLIYVETDVCVLYTTHYLKHFNTFAKSLESDVSDDTKHMLELVQKALTNLTSFIGLASRVQRAYMAGADALRGM